MVEDTAKTPEATGVAPSPADDAKIVVSGVGKTYGAGGVRALENLEMSIGEGEFICLVGPSGCGKSTLLRMFAGLHRPSEGEISIQVADPGRPLSATVFQDYSIFPWKTVEANVRFGLDVAKMPKADAKKRARFWLNRMGLQDFARSYPATLSGGMRQRVSIARALAVEPEIILMDEPFAALDAQLRKILQDELLGLWQEDRRTVVFVTHSLEEAILLGDRVIVMSARPGSVIADYRVPFGRPRKPEIRAQPGFAALQEEIWTRLRGEVDRAFDRAKK